MTEPFAPSLQLPWSLVDVRSNAFDRVIVRLPTGASAASRSLRPACSAVAADPEITIEHATAEFEFTGVRLFRMCWEYAEPELATARWSSGATHSDGICNRHNYRCSATAHRRTTRRGFGTISSSVASSSMSFASPHLKYYAMPTMTSHQRPNHALQQPLAALVPAFRL